MPERKSNGRRKRAVVAIAASAGIVAAVVTGVNYASASSSVPRSAPQEAAQYAAQSPARSAGQPAAQSAGRFAPNVVEDAGSVAPQGGDGRTNSSAARNNEGRVLVNERTFAAEHGVCVAVVSSQSASFNVRNESDETVEFFNGITCDNGAPIATIGPRSSSSAIAGTLVAGTGITAIVGSFRVIDNHDRH
ncbi:hypothetical protein [Streptomyces sp. NPDC046862]|uniref:hypothetical protein n=1 Tax=Streptomyces sp. NPDC046862 TaxID=3154603 RepID=UPI0034550F83